MKKRTVILCAVVQLMFTAMARGEERFSESVGGVTVAPVQSVRPITVPYITWGGDIATFYANGGLTTKNGSIFQQLGLELKLKAGDNFHQQVKDYMEGRSPFLRGTFRMIGMASEVIGSDPRTKGVVIMQMTWSAGDHMVARSDIRTVRDIKGRTIVLQKGGPHVGMLDDILKTAGLGWDDIKILWADDLTGTANSPAEIFRKNQEVGACFVISPDMIGLTSGLHQIGSGAEGTVKGARVLVSTAELSRSIVDVYVCRKDFFDANRALVEKFVAGYFKACEKIVDLKKEYEAKGSDEYMQVLRLTQEIYGKKTIPTLEEDAHGLLCDCTFVGYPGNVVFFTEKNNPNGFEAFQKSALDLAVSRGYAGVRSGFFPSGLDYNAPVFTGYLTKTKIEKGERFRAEAVLKEIEDLSKGGGLDDKTIVAFTIGFEPNQTEFSAVQYGSEYQRVVEMVGKYGNAVFAIRGHADPTKTLLEVIQAGMQKGILKRTGAKGDYRYSCNGRPLNLESTKDVLRLIEEGAFDNVPGFNPRQTMQAALNLSLKRAEAVRDSIIEYAKSKGLTIDPTQIQPVGVGIREPFVAKPNNLEEARQNMRVEFRLLRVQAEAATASDFDY